MGNYSGSFTQTAHPDAALGGVAIGTVLPWAAPVGTTVPTGFMLCDGTALIQYNNYALYSVIGQTHGNGSRNGNSVVTGFFPAWSSATTYNLGDTSSVSGTNYISLVAGNLNHNPSTSPTFWAVTFGFNIPDYRGRFHRGLDNMSSSIGAASRDPGDRSGMLVGSPAASVGSQQVDTYQGHGHTVWGTLARGTWANSYGNWVISGGATNFGAYIRAIASDGVNGAPRVGIETRAWNSAALFIIRVF